MRSFPGILLAGLICSSVHAACPPVLDHSFQSLTDREVPLCQFKGKVVLVVNTASYCGYTPQYKGLEALYRRYRERGFVVLGFPANDFGAQEPGSNREIAKFCELNYGVSFPMFAKTSVVTGAGNALYTDLAAKTGERPQWNFHKYLIDRSGDAVQSFGSGIAPDDPKLVREIERLLTVGDGKP